MNQVREITVLTVLWLALNVAAYYEVYMFKKDHPDLKPFRNNFSEIQKAD